MDSSGNILHLTKTEIERIGERNCVRGIVRSRKISFHKVVASRNSDSVSITPGKVKLSLGEHEVEDLLSILKDIAEIDKNAHHELSFEERYENIENYERDGYILASYAKVEGGRYRVVFQVPFYSDNALNRFASSLPEEGFERSIFWEGSDPRIAQLLTVLLDSGWTPVDMFLDVQEKVGPTERKGRKAKALFERLVPEE